MTYVILSVIFASLATNAKVFYVCIRLCVFNMFMFVVSLFCDKNNDVVYWLKVLITTLVGLSVCNARTKLAFYITSLQVAILCVYALPAYEISQGGNVLSHTKLDSVIYGIIACQYLGVYATLRSFDYDKFKHRILNILHIPRN